jgi:general secretion pathway protein D
MRTSFASRLTRTQRVGARRAKYVFALLFAIAVSGCAAWDANRTGQQLLAEGNIDAGLSKLAEASRLEPTNAQYRQQYALQREAAVTDAMKRAQAALDSNQFDAARRQYERALQLDPGRVAARVGLERIDMLARHASMLDRAQELARKGELAEAREIASVVLRENPTDRRSGVLLRTWANQSSTTGSMSAKLKASYRKPVTLSFRDATLQQVFESLRLAAGVNFMFDRDVRTDSRVSIAITNKPLEDVMKVVLAGQRLASRVLDEDTLLIYPNTPEKQRDYQELVIRTIYLGNADASRAVNLARNVVKVRDAYVDEKLNILVLRDTAEVIRVAERVLANIDVAEPEVMLEFEVLEVSHNKIREVGIRYPDTLAVSLQGAAGAGRLTLPEWQSRSSGLVNLIFNDPLAVLNLRQSDGDASLLANPRIRTKNRQSAKVLIGERVPVITTTAIANVGSTESVNYLDVGLKLDVEPTVALDDEVTMKVALEVSSIIGTVTRSSGLQAYRLGTRNTSTMLRVRDGETQVLAGLIQREDRRTGTGIPFLSSLPVLSRLFATTGDNETRTEIILLITPRVVRNLVVPGQDQLEIVHGTEASTGGGTLQMTPASVRPQQPVSSQPVPPFGIPPGAPIGPPLVTPSAPIAPAPVPQPQPFTPPPMVPRSPTSGVDHKPSS